MRYLKQLLALAFVLLLASCGGGGGCSGTPFGTSGGTNSCGSTSPTGSAAVASIALTLSKPTINNAGGDLAVLTTTVLDGNNNVIGGVPVSVSVSSGVYTPLSTTTAATGATAGQVSGNITIGALKDNRNITATVSAGGLTSTTVVAVTGSKLSITPVPGAPTANTSVVLTVKAMDANSVGIPGVNITLSDPSSAGWTLPAPGTPLITDNSGNVTVTVTSPTSAGIAPLTASGSGVSVTNSVSVGTGTGAANPIGAVSASLAINPNTIGTNATGVTTSRATLRALFLDSLNQPVKNIRVRFELDPAFTALGSGEAISTGSSIVYTDPTGVAVADYIAGTRSSPTNGVHIRACWGLLDSDIVNTATSPPTLLCPNSAIGTLTVAGTALSITLGDNNILSRGNLALTYIKNFVVQVNDSSGAAVSGALVSASVDITHFGKGYAYNDPYYISGLTTLLSTPPDITFNYTTSLSPTDIPVVGNPVPVPPVLGKRVWCINEDLNRNGVLDPGEDINGNGLEPAKAEVIISAVSGWTTAADGTLALQVQYPMNMATWLAYTVTVSTGVGGSQGSKHKSYVTAYILGDETNGPFKTPQYGVSSCNQPN